MKIEVVIPAKPCLHEAIRRFPDPMFTYGQESGNQIEIFLLGPGSRDRSPGMTIFTSISDIRHTKYGFREKAYGKDTYTNTRRQPG